MDALKSIIRPITHSLPGPIRELGIRIIGDQCYDSLLLKVNFEDVHCIRLSVSKVLGIGIVGASSVVKFPQIIKLVNSQSAAGISLASYVLETCSFLISLAYNFRNEFPFSTYGETLLILVQNVVVTSLVLHFAWPSGSAPVFMSGIAAAASALFSPTILDMNTLGYLQAGAGVLGVASKLPQIWVIWQEGSTGQLSALTVNHPPFFPINFFFFFFFFFLEVPFFCFIFRASKIVHCSASQSLTSLLFHLQVFSFLLGSLSRIFTTIQEVDDRLILYGFVAGFILNLILAAQMVFYWSVPSKKALGKKPMPIVEPEGFSASTSAGSSPTQTAPVKRAGPSTRRRG